MQPNNQFPSPNGIPPSTDYLDQIATQPTVKTMNPMVLWSLIGGVLVLVIVVVLGISTAAGNNASTTNLAGVGTQLSTLGTVSEEAQKNLQSGELRSVNSGLTLVLTNANRDMTAPLTAQKINVEDPKKNKSVAKVLASSAALTARLEDARLNAVFDRTYSREMSFSLKTLRSDISVLLKSTRSKSLKEILNTTDNNLAPLLESFENYNGS